MGSQVQNFKMQQQRFHLLINFFIHRCRIDEGLEVQAARV